MRIPSPVVKRRVRIEIIPLIDIIFFLLATFVLLALTMVKDHGIRVNTPATESNDNISSNSSATITLTAGHQIFFNKAPISLQQLPLRLANLKSTNADPEITVNGDRSVEFGMPLTVLDMVRQSGITRVSVETQPMVRGH